MSCIQILDYLYVKNKWDKVFEHDGGIYFEDESTKGHDRVSVDINYFWQVDGEDRVIVIEKDESYFSVDTIKHSDLTPNQMEAIGRVNYIVTKALHEYQEELSTNA